MKINGVSIITQTGSDLPLSEAQELGVEVIPDLVFFGDQEFKNMIDISAEEFYRKLEEDVNFPTSSHPSAGDFIQAFRKAQNDGAKEILCLLVTSKMSGSYRTALAAAAMGKRQGITIPIHVYDTMQVSHAMAEMIRMAVKMADEGKETSDIIQALDQQQKQTAMYFVLDSLKNAKKGGRVGAIKAATVDALHIKPLLLFADGVVDDYGIAMGFRDGLNKIADRFFREYSGDGSVTLFHGDHAAMAEVLKKMLLDKMPALEIRMEWVGPVIGIYAGKGSVGVAFTKKKEVG